MADGRIDEGEKRLLKSFAGRLNVPESIFTELLDKVRLLSDDSPQA